MNLFRLSRPEAFQRQSMHEVGAKSPWMRQLQCGLAVTVGLEDGFTRSQEESRQHWGEELHAVLSKLSVGFRSAVLLPLPLPCPKGLYVLVLVNRLPLRETSSRSSIGSRSIGFSRSDVDRFLHSGLYRRVVCALTATHTAHSAHLLLKQNMRLRVQTDQLMALIGTQEGGVTEQGQGQGQGQGQETDPDSAPHMFSSMMTYLQQNNPHSSMQSHTLLHTTSGGIKGERRSSWGREGSEVQGPQLLKSLTERAEYILKQYFPDDTVQLSAAREIIDLSGGIGGDKTLRGFVSTVRSTDLESYFAEKKEGRVDRADEAGDVLYVTMTRQKSGLPYSESEVLLLGPYLRHFFATISVSVCLSVCLCVCVSACLC